MFHKESNKVKVTNCCGLQGGKMFKDYLLTVEAPCRKKKNNHICKWRSANITAVSWRN